MRLTSALPDLNSALAIGLGTAGAVVGIYSHALPNMADVRLTDPHNPTVEASRKHAAITSAALIGAVYLLTRDRNVFILAGSVMVAVDYTVKHANAVNPATNRLDYSPSGGSIAPEMAAPLPEYTDDVA
jgi:hypothetical protein